MVLFNKTLLSGVSASIPRHRVHIHDMGFDIKTVDRISKLTGIREVCVAPEGMTTADYCIDAAEHLFSEMQFDRSQIDGIVYVTPQPDYIVPGTVGVLQRRLGLPKKCVAMDIKHGCPGFIYALFQAVLLVESGFCRNVLTCCGDIPTRNVNAKDKSMRLVHGDGGAAMLVTASEVGHPSAFAFHHDGTGLEYLYVPAGGARMPRKPGVTDQPVEDAEGNVHTLENVRMNGLELMRYIVTEVPGTIQEVMEAQDWGQEDVTAYALHQANAFIVKSLSRQMGLPLDKVPVDMEDTGNIGAASVALLLCRQMEKSALDLRRTVMSGFGTGLSSGAAAMDLSGTYFSPVHEI